MEIDFFVGYMDSMRIEANKNVIKTNRNVHVAHTDRCRNPIPLEYNVGSIVGGEKWNRTNYFPNHVPPGLDANVFGLLIRRKASRFN